MRAAGGETNADAGEEADAAEPGGDDAGVDMWEEEEIDPNQDYGGFDPYYDAGNPDPYYDAGSDTNGDAG